MIDPEKIQIDPEGGNTQTPSSLNEKPKQSPQRKNHFFTYNNYKEEEIDPIVSTLKRFAFKGKIQSEIGKNGTPHLQGMIWCNEKHRDTEFKLPKEIHWETLKDTDNRSNYCAKDKTYDGKFRIEWGFPKPLKLITPTYDWQLEILEILKSEPNDRTSYWYWSENGGVGKSQFAKYLVVKENCLFFDTGKKADIMHLIFTAPEDKLERMIIDIPRDDGNDLCYKAIESLKTGLIYNSKYETGFKTFNSPHIIVFANQPPDLPRMSEDRWIVKQIG